MLGDFHAGNFSIYGISILVIEVDLTLCYKIIIKSHGLEEMMSEIKNEPGMPAASPVSFYKIWIDALTKPNEGTYASLAAAPGANANKAFLWVFLAALINSLFAVLVQGQWMRNMTEAFGGDLGSISGGIGASIITAICGAPLGAAVFVLFFAISVGIYQWIAGLFGGQGNFGQLAYVLGAITAPYILINSLLTLLAVIPFVGFCFTALAGIFGLYILVLVVMAVKGVNRFGWGPAIGSVFLPLLVFGFLCACLTFGTLMLLGPAIGDVFSSINQSLGGY